MNPYCLAFYPTARTNEKRLPPNSTLGPTIPSHYSAISDSTVRAECSFVPKKMPTPSCIALANTAL